MDIRDQVILKSRVDCGTFVDWRCHVQQLLDRDGRPRGILRRPFAECVVNIQHARRLKLQYQDGGEALSDAADLKQRVRADWLPILERRATAGDVERRPCSRKAD